MDEYSLDDKVRMISDLTANIQRSPEETGKGIKDFKKMFDRFMSLSDAEKAEFWKEAFNNPENKDACESFVKRHPECSMGAFIPKDKFADKD